MDKTEEFKQQIQDTVLGFDFTEIADAIIDVFTDSSIDNALETFAGKVDAILAKVVKNMLQRNMLVAPIQKMTEDLYKSMVKKDANGNTTYELTADAAKKFKDGVLSLGQNFQNAWKVLEDQFGSAGITLSPKDEDKDTENDRVASTGKGLETISQDSAEEIVGLMRMLIIYCDKESNSLVSINVNIVRGLGLLTQIVDNTNRLEKIESHLFSIKEGIDDMDDNGIIVKR